MPSLDQFFASPLGSPTSFGPTDPAAIDRADAFVSRAEHVKLDMRILRKHVRPPENSPLMWGDSCSRGSTEADKERKRKVPKKVAKESGLKVKKKYMTKKRRQEEEEKKENNEEDKKMKNESEEEK
uniref:Uncharacterized protein n=1 Tax=Corethron hystrix TaxID=216773 RepID=A0A7S1BM83_9STRA|mmetsp:Transcript_33802/g.78053  ORF Transcript_33802/g.78053 Transcript_33802/m.78053 type:complete len:126 (+) Transcript_33802:485-862(+)